MSFIFYTLFLIVLAIALNYIFKKNGILISDTGDAHQKYTSSSKVPLTGGIIIFFGLIYFFGNDKILIYLFFTLILIVGIFSDLKILTSASLRFLIQIIIVLLFVILHDLKIFDTRVIILNKLLDNIYFNYIFVTFCILIVINGSNFIDGLNTLNIGYYILIFVVLIFLRNNGDILYSNNITNYYLVFLCVIFVLNILNHLYLGDSGSYLLGFLFSVILIETYNLNNNLSPFFIILLLWYPCYETLFSIIRKNVVKKSPMEPDTNHLHQLIFYYLIERYKMQKFISNLITSNIINLYNLFIFLVAVTNSSSTQTQIILILLNLFVYSYIYFKIYYYKIKKIS